MKIYQGKSKYLCWKTDDDHDAYPIRFIKYNSLFIPFESRLEINNYICFRFSLFGYGIEYRVMWYDVKSEVLDAIASKRIVESNVDSLITMIVDSEPKLKIL